MGRHAVCYMYEENVHERLRGRRCAKLLHRDAQDVLPVRVHAHIESFNVGPKKRDTILEHDRACLTSSEPPIKRRCLAEPEFRVLTRCSGTRVSRLLTHPPTQKH